MVGAENEDIIVGPGWGFDRIGLRNKEPFGT